jgi:hypothetical protein
MSYLVERVMDFLDLGLPLKRISTALALMVLVIGVADRHALMSGLESWAYVQQCHILGEVARQFTAAAHAKFHVVPSGGGCALSPSHG